MVLISLSAGAWRASKRVPSRQVVQASRPSVPISSFKKYEPRSALVHPFTISICPLGNVQHPGAGNSYLTNTLKAPRGVTRTAGAKAYAVVLSNSPIITRMCQDQGTLCLCNKTGCCCTHANPNPPDRGPNILEPVSIVAVSFHRLSQALDLCIRRWCG